MAHLPDRPRPDAGAVAEVAMRWAGGSVVIDGTVHSLAAHEAVLRAARALPGVRHVDDRLSIRLTVGLI